MNDFALRWFLLILALPASFVLAGGIGLFLFGQIEAMCPVAWQYYPLCRWPWWIGHLSLWPFYFAFGAISTILITGLAPQHKLNIGLIALNIVGVLTGLMSLIWSPEESLVQFWASCVAAVALAYGGGILGLILILSRSEAITSDGTRSSSSIATDDSCT